MTDTRDDHSPGDHGSHLAHWPPRLRGHEHRPVHVKLHQAGEPIQQEKPHGLGLTRSAFADDGD